MLKKLTVLTGTAALVLTSFALAGAQQQPGTTATPGVQGVQKREMGRRDEGPSRSTWGFSRNAPAKPL